MKSVSGFCSDEASKILSLAILFNRLVVGFRIFTLMPKQHLSLMLLFHKSSKVSSVGICINATIIIFSV